jgi:hypothetical protein
VGGELMDLGAPPEESAPALVPAVTVRECWLRASPEQYDAAAPNGVLRNEAVAAIPHLWKLATRDGEAEIDGQGAAQHGAADKLDATVALAELLERGRGSEQVAELLMSGHSIMRMALQSTFGLPELSSMGTRVARPGFFEPVSTEQALADSWTSAVVLSGYKDWGLSKHAEYQHALWDHMYSGMPSYFGAMAQHMSAMDAAAIEAAPEHMMSAARQFMAIAADESLRLPLRTGAMFILGARSALMTVDASADLTAAAVDIAHTLFEEGLVEVAESILGAPSGGVRMHSGTYGVLMCLDYCSQLALKKEGCCDDPAASTMAGVAAFFVKLIHRMAEPGARPHVLAAKGAAQALARFASTQGGLALLRAQPSLSHAMQWWAFFLRRLFLRQF